MSMTDTWRPKRPGPASDRDSATRQTLRAGIRAPPPEKPYITHRAMGQHGTAALERGVRFGHVAGCCCCLDSVVVGGFLQGRVAAVSLDATKACLTAARAQ